MSGELCGESLPELVPALLFALVVWGVHCQNAKWSLGCVDGESKESAVDGCEVWSCDQGDARKGLSWLAFAVVFFSGAVCDGLSIDHELVWLLDVCLCERQPAEAVISHDVDQCVQCAVWLLQAIRWCSRKRLEGVAVGWFAGRAWFCPSCWVGQCGF